MKNILAVCGFGVGSSMVLKMQIEKVFQQLNKDVVVDNTDIASALGMNPDVIYTSKEFAIQLRDSGASCPIIEVQHFMNYDEVYTATINFLAKM